MTFSTRIGGSQPGGGGGGSVSTIVAQGGPFLANGTITSTGTINNSSASLTPHGVLLGQGTGAATATPAGTNGQLLIATTAGDPAFTTMSGDATIANTGAITLKNSGVTPATYGDATHVPQLVVDAQGRITSATSIAISGGGIGTIIADGISNTNTSQPYTGLVPVAPPILTNWINQNSATITAITNGGLNLFTKSTTAVGNGSWSLRTKAFTPAPITLVTCYNYNDIPGTNGPEFGIVLTDGTAFACAGISIVAGSAVMTATAQKWTNTTTFSTNYGVASIAVFNPIWNRIIYDGVSAFSVDISPDGLSWQNVGTTASLGITPNAIGFGVNVINNNSTYGAGMTIQYWSGA